LAVRNLLAVAVLVVAAAACSALPVRDPLRIDVAGIDPLPSEGLEMRLAVRVRIQNPNDTVIDYSGAALDLALNGRRLASGVSDEIGTVPRYGETVLTIPVTISAFNVARQLVGFISSTAPSDVTYRVSGKLEGGLFGTRRFSDEGSFELMLPSGSEP
jgi:LEA14-like dessication related protein